jgi:hypothetical protein
MISDVLWQRPSREEFDVWGTELGNGPTWSFDALEPYYRKAENWTGPPIKTLPGGQKDHHALGKVFGKNGPMQISYNNYYPGLIEESVAAANNLGARTSSNPVSPSFPNNGARRFFFFLAPLALWHWRWHSPPEKLTLKPFAPICRKRVTPLVSLPPPVRSTRDREPGLLRSRDISSQMPIGKTSSCSPARKLPRFCSRQSETPRIRRRPGLRRRLSSCRVGRSTR